MSDTLIECRGLCKDYDMGGEVIHALRDVTLAIGRGEQVAVTGASGSGKSTLMNLVGALDTPTRGHLGLNGGGRVVVEELDPQTVRGRPFRAFRLLRSFVPTRSGTLELPVSFLQFGRVERRGEGREPRLVLLQGLRPRREHLGLLHLLRRPKLRPLRRKSRSWEYLDL